MTDPTSSLIWEALEAAKFALQDLHACQNPECSEQNCNHAYVKVVAALKTRDISATENGTSMGYENPASAKTTRGDETLIEKTARIMSDAVHDKPWNELKVISPITADAELRRAKAIVTQGEIPGNTPVCLPQNEDKKVCSSKDADLEDVSEIIHCYDCKKRLSIEEIKYLHNTCNDCEREAWEDVLHEKKGKQADPVNEAAFEATVQQWAQAGYKVFTTKRLRRLIACYLDHLPQDKTYGYASRLFKHLAPQCTPLPDTLGVLTQLDNYITGLREPKRDLRPTSMSGSTERE